MLLIGAADIFQVQGRAAGPKLLFSLLKDTLRLSREEQELLGQPHTYQGADGLRGAGPWQRGCPLTSACPPPPTEAFYETFPRWPTAFMSWFHCKQGEVGN